MRKIIFACLAMTLVIACTHKSNSPAPVINNPVDTLVQDTIKYIPDTVVCFQRDVLPIFIASCAKAGCHDAVTKKSGYNLTTYSTIIAKGLVKYNLTSSKLYSTCLSGKMPQSPTPKLDSTQLSYLRRWIMMGAPNDTNCAVNCDTTKFTYATGIKPIIGQYCNGCHATAVAASSGGNIVLDTYAGLSAQAANGKLVGDLQHSAGFNAMPLGGSKLPDCMITQVKKWIAAGTLNN